jgi:hypothetical protein
VKYRQGGIAVAEGGRQLYLDHCIDGVEWVKTASSTIFARHKLTGDLGSNSSKGWNCNGGEESCETGNIVKIG